MIERKTIDIYAIDFDTTISITYNVIGEDDIVSNLQFWIREDYKYNYSILRRILDMFSKLENIEPFSENTEKDIFKAYQETFDITFITENYKLTTSNFNTQRISNDQKPHRNFTKVTKESINKFIKDYIEKGDE